VKVNSFDFWPFSCKVDLCNKVFQ